MKKFIPLFVTVLMLTLFASPVFALGENGSFETGTTDPGLYVTLNDGNTSITNWTVTSGSVDYIGTLWPASVGARSIDVSGNEAGSISQTFTTVIGATYDVTFDMAGNPGVQGLKTMDVSATGGTVDSYEFNTTGKSLTDMGWEEMEFTFIATATDTTLTFTSTTVSAYGPALDNVVITETLVPEDPEEPGDEVGRPTDNHGWWVSNSDKEFRNDAARSSTGMPTTSNKNHAKK
ncbi:hypothetical protein A3K01_03915 [candidate division WWE3 bacterium RIFOXYD1_FULL_43_17]|uniref:DUF642 domain-containing protein n=3 Tax=Katanobacteria TaxID=422282 RepID=A0A1F4XF80_UNCKA|nr:MAG: hypothetical protein UU59_C0001G0038 [candidate division WWE3 bacterium GW2011_GWE1_41_27]KKS60737.1 MAG: hypothetical protein UV26_C0002G0063 [candidate division WWE3 bacterium GW2011_GWF2_42_42]OGC80322.1 MAG: hypothetical protein A3K01_03915 [candidate division WWE3 bacterium RIFOXYD1_FULL_43_17]